MPLRAFYWQLSKPIKPFDPLSWFGTYGNRWENSRSPAWLYGRDGDSPV